MCGIVGAAARRDIVPVLIEGLKRLEYRGYDSCGVAVLNGSGVGRLRSVERVADLAAQMHELSAVLAHDLCDHAADHRPAFAVDPRE